jgi:xanthine dehydrogenase molybdenum-binding subunit
MIYNDFIYIKPDSLKEAYEVYKSYANKNIFYYSGGTEIITFSRKGLISPDVLIDLKSIKESNDLFYENDNLVIGSTLPLNLIIDSNYSKIISKSIRFIADRTLRNKITIGGNILGQLPFREAVLPLLLLDAKLRIFGENGFKEVNINDIFDKNLKINKGEILFQILINRDYLNLDFYYDRRVFYSKVDYPIVSALFVKFGNSIRMAITGAFNFPLRDYESEKILNSSDLKTKDKIEKILDKFSVYFKSDFRASKEYRKELLKIILEDSLNYFGG